ncbi:MAG: cytochrome P460 family protein [Hyphomicrobiales bacterium]|nr:cytochrome P460 family protein [Hyphomicrobiales bacterium]
MRISPIVTGVAVVFGAIVIATGHTAAESFSPYVDDRGNISIPKDFRSWQFLGSWGVATDEDNKVGSKGFHNVYTQPETLAAFRATGKFPDGAVLVKELLKARTDSMTTGEISYATETEGWFIMVKDAKGRFTGNKLWGDGWGWALFKSDDTATTVTVDYKADCLTCHVPARKDDWVYLRGYPGLKN